MDKQQIKDFIDKGWRVYENPPGPAEMGFKGIVHPLTEEQVVPAMKSALANGIEWLEAQKRDKGLESVPVDETIGFLQMVLGLSEVEKGYICCPNPPDMPMPCVLDPDSAPTWTKGILTRYGKKLQQEKKE